MGKKANEVRKFLAKKFAYPEFVFIPEVKLGDRRADAVACNLWASRGRLIHGFEIKVGRTDLHQELKNPLKADRFWQECDKWWLVCPQEIWTSQHRLPPTWGLILLDGNTLRTAVEAPTNENAQPSRELHTRLLKRVAKNSEVNRRKANKLTKQGVDPSLKTQNMLLTQEILRRKRIASDFRKRTGVSIEKYDRQVGRLVAVAETIEQGIIETMAKETKKLAKLLGVAAEELCTSKQT